MARICPKCKCKNLKKDFSIESFARGSVFNDYVCNECGYSGQFFPEVDD